jgi:hypothetical protein
MILGIVLMAYHSNGQTIELKGDRLVYKDVEIIENVIDYATYTTTTDQTLLFTIEAKKNNQCLEDLVCGNFIRVYTVKRDQLQLIYENDFTEVNPWEIDVGMIDRDHVLDVYVGAVTETAYYPLEKRPFFFHWTNDCLTRKWTGSYIGFTSLVSIELKDYTGDGVDEVVKTGMTETGDVTTEIYRWGNFGFYTIY